MSNEVYGYIEIPVLSDVAKCFDKLERDTGFGIKQISISALYNFPQGILPSGRVESSAFIIGDQPGKTNTSYLTDYMNYAPGSEIGFPENGKERLSLLLDFFEKIIVETSAQRFVVAITESSEIEKVKQIRIQELGKVVHEDFELCNGSPNCIYDVDI